MRKIDEKIDIFSKNINTLRHKKVALVLVYVKCRRERPLQFTSKCLTNLNSSHRKTPSHKILFQNIGLKKKLIRKNKNKIFTWTPCISVIINFWNKLSMAKSQYFYPRNMQFYCVPLVMGHPVDGNFKIYYS